MRAGLLQLVPRYFPSPVSVASLLPQSPAPCVLVAAAAAQQLRSATTAATAAKLAPPTIRMTTLERRITPTAATTTTKTLTLDSATEKIVANLLASKKHPGRLPSLSCFGLC